MCHSIWRFLCVLWVLCSHVAAVSTDNAPASSSAQPPRLSISAQAPEPRLSISDTDPSSCEEAGEPDEADSDSESVSLMGTPIPRTPVDSDVEVIRVTRYQPYETYEWIDRCAPRMLTTEQIMTHPPLSTIIARGYPLPVGSIWQVWCGKIWDRHVDEHRARVRRMLQSDSE